MSGMLIDSIMGTIDHIYCDNTFHVITEQNHRRNTIVCPLIGSRSSSTANQRAGQKNCRSLGSQDLYFLNFFTCTKYIIIKLTNQRKSSPEWKMKKGISSGLNKY